MLKPLIRKQRSGGALLKDHGQVSFHVYHSSKERKNF